MSFQEIGYRTEKLVKMDIKVNGKEAAPLSTIVHRDKAHAIGEKICDKLKELIPRQHIKVSLEMLVVLRLIVLCADSNSGFHWR